MTIKVRSLELSLGSSLKFVFLFKIYIEFLEHWRLDNLSRCIHKEMVLGTGVFTFFASL